MRLFDEKTNEPIALPAELETFRGVKERVLEIAEPSSPGRSGKLLIESRHGVGGFNTVYPGVFRAYIAAQPREEVPSV